MSETIGQRLKREREARFLTLEKASTETRIRIVFLQALETDDYSVMPSAAQGRGFLRNYAEYLNLNIDELIAEIQKNPPVIEEISGPLQEVNLVETEIPPLIETDESSTPRFWTRWLPRKPETNTTPETPNDVQIETLLNEAEQVELREEAQENLFERIKSIFQFKRSKVEIESQIEDEVEQPIREEIKTPALPADVIFIEIGKELRERRELISLTLEEVERHTHLRAVFIKALEEGAMDKLPSPVQTRGMLVNYANFLDLDSDKVLLRFADALQARRHEKYAEIPREKIQTQVQASIPWVRAFIAGDLVFGVAIITALVALAIWGMSSVVRLQAEQEQATPTVIPFVDVFSQPSSTPTLESTLVADDPALVTADVVSSEEVVSSIDANVVVSLFALERVFVRVSVDGEVVFEGRMAPRETKVFQAQDRVVVLSGDGSALRITYNEEDIGLMGGAGEVVSLVYLVSGVVTPTATQPPTATNTALVTSTPTRTITPTATATPTSSQ